MSQGSGGNGVLRYLCLLMFKTDLRDTNRKLFLSHFLDKLAVKNLCVTGYRMRIPIIRGNNDRRILVNFHIDPDVMAQGSVEFDCALLMREIDHEWHGREDLCCPMGPWGLISHLQRFPAVNR